MEQPPTIQKPSLVHNKKLQWPPSEKGMIIQKPNSVDKSPPKDSSILDWGSTNPSLFYKWESYLKTLKLNKSHRFLKTRFNSLIK